MARKSRKETNYRTSDVLNHALELNIYKAALYVRLSKETAETMARDTIGIQLALLQEFAATIPDLKVIDIYIDDDITGTNFQRPDYERMMRDIDTGKINCIIVKDLSRFARDHIGAGEYLDKTFPEKGIRFIAVTDNIDTLSGDGGIIVPFKNYMNERYAKDSAKKIKDHFEKMQGNGEFCSWKPSFGYKRSETDKHLFVIDEEAASIVRKIFDWFDNGFTIHKICKCLGEENIPCPTEYALEQKQFQGGGVKDRKYHWNPEVVNKILSNEQYCGHMVQHKTESLFLYTGKKGDYKSIGLEDWVIVKNKHEAIISEEQFEKIKERLQHNAKKHEEKLQKNKHIKNPEYCLKGFVKCGHCGKSINVKRRVKNGEAKYSYVCSMHDCFGNTRCIKKDMDFEETNKVVFLTLKRHIDLFFDMEKAVKELGNSSEAKRKLDTLKKYLRKQEVELRKLRVLKSKLYEDFCIGLLDESDYTDMSKHYRDSIVEKEKEIGIINNKIEMYQVEKVFDHSLEQKLEKFRRSRKLTKEMVQAFVNSITIDNDGTLDIDLKIKDEYDELYRKVIIIEGEMKDAV